MKYDCDTIIFIENILILFLFKKEKMLVLLLKITLVFYIIHKYIVKL